MPGSRPILRQVKKGMQAEYSEDGIQLTDVEQEQNGLYTYDRQSKFDPEILRSIMSRKAAIEKE